MTTSEQAGGRFLPRGANSPVATPDLARLTIHDRDGVTVGAIEGELDLSSAGEIERKLTELSNLAPGLAVDLRATSYLDSTGIALFYDLALRLRQRLQELVIVCPSGSVPRRAIELTALHTQITVLEDIEPAIRLLRAAMTPGT